jgi:hypothetical protein
MCAFLEILENAVSKALYFSREPWKLLFQAIPEIHAYIHIYMPWWITAFFVCFWHFLSLASWMLPQAENQLEMHCAAR